MRSRPQYGQKSRYFMRDVGTHDFFPAPNRISTRFSVVGPRLRGQKLIHEPYLPTPTNKTVVNNVYETIRLLQSVTRQLRTSPESVWYLLYHDIIIFSIPIRAPSYAAGVVNGKKMQSLNYWKKSHWFHDMTLHLTKH